MDLPAVCRYSTQTQGSAGGGGGVDPNAPAEGDWRAQLQPEARGRIVNNMIMVTLKKHLPVPVPEELSELQKIALRFEDMIYKKAADQSDYLWKITLKMVPIETKTRHAPGNAEVIPNQNKPSQGAETMSLNFGLERRLVAVTGMLDDARHLCHYYQNRIETLEERLVEANITLAAINAAREAAETVVEDAITGAHVENASAHAVFMSEGQEEPLQDPVPSAQQRRARHHPRIMVTLMKKRLRVKKRRLTPRAIAPRMLALPAQPPTQEEQAHQSQEEEDPEEMIPATQKKKMQLSLSTKCTSY
ncbi:hypothetical protein ACQ4PT_014595 [Festuca glaucescens]